MNKGKQFHVLSQEGFLELRKIIIPNYLREYFNNKKSINILEAGCGRKWSLDMTGINYVLMGLDISEKALEIRKNQQQDLDEIIVGDLETIELIEAQYDVIYCSYVLEHMKRVNDVLDKFFRWLIPNGLLILAIPDRNTVVGFLTRVTPLWFHTQYYRYVRKCATAGKPGHGPFKTYLDKIVSRKGIHDYCKSHGHQITIEYAKEFDAKEEFGYYSSVFYTLFKLIEIISFKKLTPNYTNVMFVIKKCHN